MSKTVILDDSVIDGLSPSYEINAKDVATVLTNEAKTLADNYLIPFLFTGHTTNFTSVSDVDRVKIMTRRILNASPEKLGDEYDSYEDYMTKMVRAIRNLEVVKTVDANPMLKSSSEIFGGIDAEEETLLGVLDEKEKPSKRKLGDYLKNTTFKQLSDTNKLGAAYAGTTDESRSFRGKLEGLSRREEGEDSEAYESRMKRITRDLIDMRKIYENMKFSDKGNFATFTLSTKEYYNDLFSEMGFDMDENFARTGTSKKREYNGEKVAAILEKHLESNKDAKSGVSPTGFKVDFDTNEVISVGKEDENGNWTYEDNELDEKFEESKKELLSKDRIKGMANRIVESDLSFFKPKGEDLVININDIVVEVDFSKNRPRIRIFQPNTEEDLKLLSRKQFVQTEGRAGTTPLVKIGSINKKLKTLERYIARL